MRLLQELTEICGPSGNEEKVRKFIAGEIGNFCDEIFTDSLGNLIAVKKSGMKDAKNIMLAAHMDEVGIVATYIDQDGFVRFGRLGRISLTGLVNKKVIFTNGAIGVVRAETKEGEKLHINKMFVDVGGGEVEVGEAATFLGSFDEMGGMISAKSLDDRVGCYVLIKVIQEIENFSNNLYFVFTAQEELGLRGARVSAYAVEPWAAISVDVTPACDYPGDEKPQIKLGAGVAVKVKDGSIICHPAIKGMLENAAKKLGLEYQLEVLSRGGTDSGAIHLTRGGVPSGVLSIPTRYVHTSCEMVAKKDVLDAVEVLKEVLS